MGLLTVPPISLTKDTIAEVVIFYKPTTKAGLSPAHANQRFRFQCSSSENWCCMDGSEDLVWRCPFSHTQTLSSSGAVACTKHRYCNWFQLIAEYHWPPPSRSRSLQARVIWVTQITRCGSVNQLADSNDSGSRQPSTLPAANLQHVQQSPFFSSLPYSSSICRAVCPCVCTRGESGQFQTLFLSEQGYIRSHFFLFILLFPEKSINP